MTTPFDEHRNDVTDEAFIYILCLTILYLLKLLKTAMKLLVPPYPPIVLTRLCIVDTADEVTADGHDAPDPLVLRHTSGPTRPTYHPTPLPLHPPCYRVSVGLHR